MKNKKTNICFFSGDITRSGGTERVATIIANELCKNKEYNISIINLEERRDTAFFKIDNSIKIEKLYDKLDRSLFHIIGIITKLKRYVKNNKIDILIDIDGILDIYSLPVKLFTKVKVISWEHFNYYQNPFVPYRKYSRRMAARWADAIVTLTEEDKEYYQDNLKIKGEILAIHNPFVWNNVETKYNADSKIILSVGRLTYQKGFDILLEIAREVMPKADGWKWIILGEGEDREKLEEKIKEYGLEEKVILKGNVTDINDYYSKAGIFVMTSRFEGLPMTLLEAKTFDLPIVSFDCKTGPRELILDSINGYLIDEGNLDAMEKAIFDLIEDDKKRKLFSQNAGEDINKFDIKVIIDKWKKLIKEI